MNIPQLRLPQKLLMDIQHQLVMLVMGNQKVAKDIFGNINLTKIKFYCIYYITFISRACLE